QDRKIAFARARDAICSDRYRATILDIAAWLNSGAWVTKGGTIVPALRERPIINFAADELERRWRKIAKKKKKFDQLDARQRHKLRISAKKAPLLNGVFRYAILRWKADRKTPRYVQGAQATTDHPWRSERFCDPQ